MSCNMDLQIQFRQLSFTHWGQHGDQHHAVTLTMSPITWFSLFSLRLTPRIPNTTKTMAPVSTRGRTAGRPQAPPLHGLKPDVFDAFVLAADEESLKIEQKENLSTVFVYSV